MIEMQRYLDTCLISRAVRGGDRGDSAMRVGREVVRLHPIADYAHVEIARG